MIKFVNGDILKAKENIICHQVNCTGTMGSGIALQIKQQFPHAYNDYKYICNCYPDEKDLLGLVRFSDTDDTADYNGEPSKKLIANLFGQHGYGREKQHTDYSALFKCLNTVRQFAERHNLSVAIPFKIGCARGGGDWEVVMDMIEKLFGDCNVNVTIYRYDLG